MARPAEAALTPEAAVETLRGLEQYEDSLSRRTGGLTWMVWGVAAAAIPLTYQVAEALALQGPQNALLGFLWVPWIAAATIVSGGLWRVQSVRMKLRFRGGQSWLVSLGFTVLFFATWAFVALVVGVEMETHATMTLVVGMFTMALSAVQSLAKWCPATPGLLAGAGIAAVGVAMGVASVPEATAALVAPFTMLLGFFALGGYFYLRG